MGLVVKVRLPFRLGFARRQPADPSPADTAGETATAHPKSDLGGRRTTRRRRGRSDRDRARGGRAANARRPSRVGRRGGLLQPLADAASQARDDGHAVEDASSTLVWLAYTSALASRATTLEDAALAALEGRLDAGPRRRAARETHKLATSLWLVEAREAARLAWEAAGLLDAGTLLGTANALRLSQIVETLHKTLRALPPPEALSPAGRPTAPLPARRRRRRGPGP